MIKSRRMRWVGNVVCVGERGAYRILVRRPLGRPRCRWDDNIKMDFSGIRMRRHGLD
jgi:hypothetical protein